MKLQVDCSGCGKRYQIDAQYAGKRLKCKQCGQAMQVPASPLDAPDLDDIAQLEVAAPAPVQGVARREPPPLRARSTSAPAAAKVKPPGSVRLALSDETARKISLALVLILAGVTIWLCKLLVDYFAGAGVPESLQNRMYIFLALVWAWVMFVYFAISTPVLLGTASLASNWTNWNLPDRPYLRAAGTMSLPTLLLLGFLTFMYRRELGPGLGLLICAPFILIITLKELMGLKWSTTFVTAGLLLVAMFLQGLAVRFINPYVLSAARSIAQLDEQSVQQYAKDHPQEMRQARQNRSSSSSSNTQTYSQSPNPAPQAPDPLTGKIEPLLTRINEAHRDAAQHTREHIQRTHAALAQELKPLKPGQQSRLWEQATSRLNELFSAAAKAPSETPPPELKTAPSDQPLAVALASEADFPSQVVSFKSVKFRPLKDAKIDLASYAARDQSQTWELPARSKLTMTMHPLLDPEQQRPWLSDRMVIAHLAREKNTFAVTVPASSEILQGRLKGIGWTRAGVRDTWGKLTRATYIARLPDAWLVVKLGDEWASEESVVAADKFIQGILPPDAPDPALAPFDPTLVVERYEGHEDPSHIIRDAGARGVEALQAYVDRSGGNSAPLRARRLLEELVGKPAGTTGGLAGGGRTSMRSAPDKPIDVEAAIKTVTGGGGHFEVRAALESLAKVEPIEAQRDVVAEVLEQLVVQDSSHADAAANALANWHRPRTVLALMPLLAEDVWPHWKADKAIKVLGKTRDKRAVFPIIRWIVKKPDLVVAAMKDMGPVAEDEVIKLLREKDAAVRSNAARILQDIGTAKCLPELRRASKDPRDRAAATIAELALDVVNERVKQARAATTAPATAPAAGN